MYTLLLTNRITNQLQQIGIENDKQLATWAKVQQKVVAADTTMRDMGNTLGSMRLRIAALRAEKEWIPAENTDAIRQNSAEIQMLEGCISRLNRTPGSGLKTWFDDLKKGVPIIDKIANPMKLLHSAINSAVDYIAGSQGVWSTQLDSQTKLAAAMNNTMGAGEGQVDAIIKLANAQERLGVLSNAVQLAGSRELATHLTKKDSLAQLLPVMNDIVAQQHGLNASQEDAAAVAAVVGNVMNGQIDALSKYGITFDEAQQNILNFGTEAEKVATITDAAASAVGGFNAALAETPEGKLQQHANTMATIQGRIGKLVTEVKASLSPIFEWFSGALGDVVTWFEDNRDTIVAVVGTIADVIGTVFNVVSYILGGVIEGFTWLFDQIREGNVPVQMIAAVIGALVLALAAAAIEARLMALWSGIVTTAQAAWTVVSNGLNLSLLANPITWIIIGIVALIAIIVYLCTCIEGWGSLWEGVIGFIEHSFDAAVGSIQLLWTGLVNGIMIGIDHIMLAWYRFREAVGLGDSSNNQAAIANINADMAARRQAIADGAARVEESQRKAAESLAGIKMSVKSDNSLADTTQELQGKLGLGGMNEDMIDANNGDNQGKTGNKPSPSGSAAQSVSEGGARNTQVTINLDKLVESIVFQGGMTENSQNVTQQVEEALLRVLYAAQMS